MNKIINGVASEYDMPNLYEVNGIQYTDNIPNNMFIGVTKEQYCEYQQLKEENNKLKKEKEELISTLNEIVKQINKETRDMKRDSKKECLLNIKYKLKGILMKLGSDK